ncbi:hypothetical protein [Thermococcus sp.]|uniref:hypothetical protein n=1 Tax=Thermococcus sp. TaxID=35749 RepID=UPI00262361A6|nr:hypothetical protein [Thermococcus sp.]
MPEISQALTFPVMGHILGDVYPGPESYRWAFSYRKVIGINAPFVAVSSRASTRLYLTRLA